MRARTTFDSKIHMFWCILLAHLKHRCSVVFGRGHGLLVSLVPLVSLVALVALGPLGTLGPFGPLSVA